MILPISAARPDRILRGGNPMRLDNEKPSDNIEDRRGRWRRRLRFSARRRRRGFRIPMGGGGGGFSINTIIILVVVYFIAKFVFGIDLLEVITGGGMQAPTAARRRNDHPQGQYRCTGGDAQGGVQTTSTDVTGDAGRDFVASVSWARPSVSGTASSSKWAGPIRSPLLFCSPASCSRPAAWRNRPWDRFIARATARSISTSPSIRT